jgi:hypothetical protein
LSYGCGYLSHLLSLGCDVTFCIIMVIWPSSCCFPLP